MPLAGAGSVLMSFHSHLQLRERGGIHPAPRALSYMCGVFGSVTIAEILHSRTKTFIAPIAKVLHTSVKASQFGEGSLSSET